MLGFLLASAVVTWVSQGYEYASYKKAVLPGLVAPLQALRTWALPFACTGCRLFMNSPAALERALPGLASLGSAHASVRADDGLCGMHGRYVAATGVCPQFAPRARTSGPSPECDA